MDLETQDEPKFSAQSETDQTAWLDLFGTLRRWRKEDERNQNISTSADDLLRGRTE